MNELERSKKMLKKPIRPADNHITTGAKKEDLNPWHREQLYKKAKKAHEKKSK